MGRVNIMEKELGLLNDIISRAGRENDKARTASYNILKTNLKFAGFELLSEFAVIYSTNPPMRWPKVLRQGHYCAIQKDGNYYVVRVDELWDGGYGIATPREFKSFGDVVVVGKIPSADGLADKHLVDDDALSLESKLERIDNAEELQRAMLPAFRASEQGIKAVEQSRLAALGMA